MWEFKVGFSGGTVDSGFEMYDERNKAKTLEVNADPQPLNPKDKKSGKNKPDPKKSVYDSELGVYLAPFFIGPTNCRVVRRSIML